MLLNSPRLWLRPATISDKHPKSLSELAEHSGREKSSLSRTLRNMERYGLIHFEPGEKRQLAPKVNDSGVEFKVSLHG